MESYNTTSTNNNILNSILARLVEFDLFLKKIREAFNNNKKLLVENDHKRKEELENQFIRDLEEIEKIVYYRFQKLIEELKINQEKYANENVKMMNEINHLKKDRLDLISKIKDSSTRINFLRTKIGELDIVNNSALSD